MISPYAFRPRGRLLDIMRQVGNPDLINLAAGLPSTECVPKVALEQAFAETLRAHADEALGYHTPDGDLRLREILVDRFQRRGIQAAPDQMVITTGCTQALHGMIRLLARPGDVVACEAPAYYATLEILGDLGIRVLPIPLRDSEGIDLDLTRTLFRRFRPTLFVICSTLSNPSGSTLSNEARIELVKICRHSGTRILEDEIYGELSEVPDLKPIRAYDDGSTVAYVTSFSKSVAPGLRIGVCLPGTDSDSFALLKCQQDMHSATLCEVAFRNYLERDELDRHLEFLRAFNRRRRELGIRLVRECFPASTRIWEPAGGFMLWVELPAGIDIERVYQEAMEMKVAFCRGAVFFTSENEHVEAMRLNCSRPTETALVKGLTILGQIMS
ncbi:MAG TPA: PLP-dependent aminotransferase family protein [Chthoniobacterales bacterium]|nr:PLP-dependent aminotransferase family protein [Chthoniobacterales bacterium]